MESKSKKSVLIVVSLILLAVVIYFGFLYQKPKSEEVAGTLGGIEKADKLQGSGLSEEELTTLKTKYNDLLQSAALQNLIKSDVFRNALADGSLTNLLSYPNLNELFSTLNGAAGFNTVLADDGFQNAMQTGNTATLQDLTCMSAYASNIPLVTALQDKNLQAFLANPDYGLILLNPDLQSLTNDKLFLVACANGDLQSLVCGIIDPL